MSTLLSVLVFFVLFGAMFGLPVLTTILFIRHREGRLQQVLREIKRQYRLRGRGNAQLVGRIEGRPLRILRDPRRGVVVSLDLLPRETRRRHAQWSRERAAGFTQTFRRMLAVSGLPQAQLGERVEGRWRFALGPYPSTDQIEEVLGVVRAGIEQEVLLAEVAAAAHEAETLPARSRLAEVSASSQQPPWLRAEAFRALITQTDDVLELEGFGARLADSQHPSLRRLAALAWERVPGSQANSPLRSLLRDEHPTVVEAAARSLAVRSGRQDQATEAILLQRLQDESGPLLHVIVRALGAVGSSRTVAELARWCERRSLSGSMRETVWRESTRIRAALGMDRTVHRGQLSVSPPGGELSAPSEPEPT